MKSKCFSSGKFKNWAIGTDNITIPQSNFIYFYFKALSMKSPAMKKTMSLTLLTSLIYNPKSYSLIS